MLDKKLIKKNFQKSLNTYNENAFVQKTMAQKLVSMLKKKSYKKILEIGSYTGILTLEIVQNVKFEEYYAIDIVDSFNFIKNLSNKISFKQANIEDFSTEEKFDLIVANASLQWTDDFYNTVLKLKSMLAVDGQILFSTFGKQNLIEIKEAFSVGLKYYSIEELKNMFPFFTFASKIEKVKFNSSIDILKHLKNTGVNSLQSSVLNFKTLKQGLKTLDEEFDSTITYNPIYITN